MKIALVRPKVGIGLGGAENYTAYVALELLRAGHEVSVIADRCEIPGVRHLRARILGRGSLAKTLSFWINARRILSRERFDVVYATGRFFPADWVRLSDPLQAAWLHLGYERPPFLWPLRPRHRLLLWLEHQSLQSARRVIANSQLVARQVAEHYPQVAEKVEVIYNGVDLQRFNLSVRRFREATRQELGFSEREKILLFVGSDWRRKGLFFLLEIFSHLPEEVRLIVAGGKSRGQKGRVFFLGTVQTPERLYGAADLLALPTRYDPFANVVVEALACGLPVVTSPENGAGELLNGAGKILPLKPESWSSGLRELLYHPPSPEVCFRKVSSLTWEAHVRRLLR